MSRRKSDCGFGPHQQSEGLSADCSGFVANSNLFLFFACPVFAGPGWGRAGGNTGGVWFEVTILIFVLLAALLQKVLNR
jgi:hypothetical protein